MRLSRAAAYGVSAVLQLIDAAPDSPIPCSHLARMGAMPERFLLQVLRNLVNHGVLRSTRGVEGGYSLQRPAEEITLLHLIEAIDGPLTPIIPPLDSIPEASHSKLQQVLNDITADACRRLAEIKITSLHPTRAGGGKEDARAAYSE